MLGKQPLERLLDLAGLAIALVSLTDESVANATLPLEMAPLARNQFRIKGRRTQHPSGFFLGSMRERIVRLFQRSRNCPARYRDS